MFCIVCVETCLLPNVEEYESDLAVELDLLSELPSVKLGPPKNEPRTPPLTSAEVDTAEFVVLALEVLPEKPCWASLATPLVTSAIARL
jgi:hypothetical protein